MPDISLSPEAFGTLQAMKRIRRLRMYEPGVAKELTDAGLAEVHDGALTITEAGTAARQQAKAIRNRLESKHAQDSKKGDAKKGDRDAKSAKKGKGR